MNMDPVKDAAPCYDQMAIVEKYEKVIAYLYPIAQSIPRKHGVARDMFLQRLLSIPDMLFQAGLCVLYIAVVYHNFTELAKE